MLLYIYMESSHFGCYKVHTFVARIGLLVMCLLNVMFDFRIATLLISIWYILSWSALYITYKSLP